MQMWKLKLEFNIKKKLKILKMLRLEDLKNIVVENE